MMGYVPLYRKIKEWEWYTEANTMRLFIHCLVTANHKDNKWRGVTVKKGSFITSVANLANELNLSSQKIRTALTNLKSTNEITIQSTNKYTIINVVNWSLYALGDDDANKQNNNQITINQQSNNKQITTNNNDNNVDNEKNEKKEPKKPLSDLEKSLEEFYKYRKKIKSDMTEHSKVLLKNKLEKLATNDKDKIAILEQSMLNGWKGVFELKSNQPNKPKSMKDNQTSLENNYGATRL